MARRKEYCPIGKDKQYDNYHFLYDSLRVQSQLLNEGSRKPGVHTKFWDKAGLEMELIQLIGIENGKFKNNWGDDVYGDIPGLRNEIKELIEEFEEGNQRKVREGFDPDTQMPKKLMERKLELEATLDVKLEEVAEIEKRLKTAADQKKKESDNKILQYGPRGYSHLHGGILDSIDGQKITQTPKGILIIAEGIYAGLSVLDYRSKICKPWVDKRNADAREKLKILRKNAKLHGRMIPNTLPVRGTSKVNPSNLPAWPKDCKNHLIDENDKKK